MAFSEVIKKSLGFITNLTRRKRNWFMEWSDRWGPGTTYPQWHMREVNDLLIKHHKHLLVEPDRRIFVPLCGKALDMKWLYDKGHLVVGVEGIEQAVKDFFVENNLEYQRTSKDHGPVYETKDSRVAIHCCDLFALSSETLGKFDGVWDRGSLVAVYPEDQERYAALMKSLLKPEFRYVLCADQYKPNTRFRGPPRNISFNKVSHLFGDLCHVTVLEKVDRSDEEKVLRWGVFDGYFESVILLTPKSVPDALEP